MWSSKSRWPEACPFQSAQLVANELNNGALVGVLLIDLIKDIIACHMNYYYIINEILLERVTYP